MRSRSAPPSARMTAGALGHFPLSVGNSWTYALEGRTAGDEARSIHITDSVERGGVVYYRLEGWPSIGGALVRQSSWGQIVALDEQTGAERLWYDFAAPVGAGWTPDTGDECLGPATIANRNAKVDTPAGTYEDALEISYGPSPCADAGVSKELFAPGVGLVQRAERSIAGPLTWQLTRAQVGGRTVEGPGLSFSIQIDRPSYTPDIEPPVTDPHRVEPKMRVRLTIVNRSEQPLSMTFPSPQLFDLEVRDERGETVYFWSADKLFPAVITELGTSPGARVFEVAVPLMAGSSPLRPGTYVVEGWLVAPAGRLYSASVPFAVTGGGR